MVLLRQLEQGMHPISCYYNPMACLSNPGSLFSGLPSTSSKLLYGSSFMKQKSKAEAKEITAEKHRNAERLRRSRHKNHYDTLRKILPNLVKEDRASVLSGAIRYLNELEKATKDIEAIAPSLENNLKKLRYCNTDRSLAEAVFSTSDRVGLISELSQSMASVKGKVVRAEIMTVGGRTKCTLYVQGLVGNKGLVRLENTLMPVVDGNSSTTNNERRKFSLSR